MIIREKSISTDEKIEVRRDKTTGMLTFSTEEELKVLEYLLAYRVIDEFIHEESQIYDKVWTWQIYNTKKILPSLMYSICWGIVELLYHYSLASW